MQGIQTPKGLSDMGIETGLLEAHFAPFGGSANLGTG